MWTKKQLSTTILHEGCEKHHCCSTITPKGVKKDNWALQLYLKGSKKQMNTTIIHEGTKGVKKSALTLHIKGVKTRDSKFSSVRHRIQIF